MSKIYYKRQYGTLECVKIEGDGRLVKIIIDEPIDARIQIANKSSRIKYGECALDLAELACGVYAPKIIYKNSSEILGKIRLREGGVSYNEPDYDFVRLLSERLSELRREVDALKDENEKLKKKINGTSIF